LRHSLTQDPDARVREIALEALAFIKDPQSVSWISTSAKAELVPSVQVAAVKTLAKIGDKNAIAALADLCESAKSDDVRAAAVEALAALPAHRRTAQPVIARVLKQSRSGKVRAAALKALSSDNSTTSCSARAERINDPDAEVRRTVVEQLAKCPASVARPALVAAARDDKDAAVRKAALGLLVKAGATKAQEALVNALQNDRDVSIRRIAIAGVLALPKKARAAALAEAAKNDADADVRRKAVQGLKSLDAEIVVPALAAVLSRDRVADIRVDAARILSAYSDAAAYQALQRAAKDPSPEVRKIAAAGAARSPAQKAWVDALLPQVIDPAVNVRLKAVTQLCALQVPRTYRALLVALWTDENASIRTAVARCFADLDHPLVDIGLSVAHTTDGDGGVIRTVELSQRQRVERQNKVLERTRSATVDERTEAARTLQPSPGKQVREALERLLDKDPDPRVRRGAATVIVQYKDRRALQKLNQASQTDRDPATRQAIASLYTNLSARWSKARNALNINTLITQLRSADAAVRIRAAQALGTLRDRRAFNPLREASAATDPALRHAAVVALATFGDLGTISKAARTEADATTKGALIQLNYLRNAPPEKIIAALASTKTDEAKRGVEAASIKQVQKAVPWLVRLALSHGDKVLRLAAVRALVLYDLPLAQWAIRVASDNDASKKSQEQMWLWAVHADAGTT
jgi:HEAT repeat protein